jgi:hypothetical protein
MGKESREASSEDSTLQTEAVPITRKGDRSMVLRGLHRAGIWTGGNGCRAKLKGRGKVKGWESE